MEQDKQGESFKKAVKDMAQAAKEHKEAAGALEKSAAAASAGEAIKKEFKGIRETFTSGIVGALGPIGTVGESLIKGAWSGKKQRKEEKLLAEQLGFLGKQGVAEMRAIAEQKQLREKQDAAIEQLEKSALSIGIPTEQLNAAVAKMRDQSERADGYQTQRDVAEKKGLDDVQAQAQKEHEQWAEQKKVEGEQNREKARIAEIEKSRIDANIDVNEAQRQAIEQDVSRAQGGAELIEDATRAQEEAARENQAMLDSAAAVEKKTVKDFYGEIREDITIPASEAFKQAQESFETQAGVQEVTVKAFYDELRSNFMLPASDAMQQARELFANQSEAHKKAAAFGLEQETPAGAVQPTVEIEKTVAAITTQVIPQMSAAMAEAMNPQAAAESMSQVVPEMSAAFAAAMNPQAGSPAGDNVISEEQLVEAREQKNLAKETQEQTAELLRHATTAGSLMVHDVGVEGTLKSWESGSAASEKEDANEKRRQQDELISTLEGIEDNTEGKKGPIDKLKGKGKGLLSGLLGGGGMFGGMEKVMANMGAKFLPGGVAGLKALAPKALAFLKVAGPVALVVGGVVAAASMVKDGIEGYNKAASGEWPVDKVSGAIGASIGGTGSGAKNAMKQAMKGAAIGGAIGLIGGPVGALIGAAVGGAVGGIAGFIGGEKIATWVDGAVKTVRNLFNIPELLTEEQKKVATDRLAEIKTEVTTFDTQIEALKKSLVEGNLTGKDRIQAMDDLAALEASRDKTLEEQATINKNLSNSNVAEAKAAVDRASEEYNNATRSAKQEKSKLFWLALRYGKDSDEYKAQVDRYNSAKQWSEDSKKKLDEEKTARAAAQTAHDTEHKTMMGNVRLFWTDFKSSIPSWDDVKEGAGAFLKDPLGSMRTAFNKFSPVIKIPSWEDTVKGVTGFFKDPAGTISTAFSSFKAKLPDMEAIKNHMPDSLVAAGEWAADKLPLLKAGLAGVALPALNLIKENMPDSLKGAGEWAKNKILGLKDKLADIKLPSMDDIKTSLTGVLDKYKIELPSWTDVKAGVTGFMADPKGALQGVLNKYNVELPSWDDVKAGVTGFLKDPKAGLTSALQAVGDNMPDFVKGAGTWAKDKLASWKTALPSVELPDLSEAMSGIADMASAAKSKVTGFFKGLFGAGDEELNARTAEEISKHGQTLKAAEKSGLYDKDWAGASEINKEALQEGVKSGMIQKDMLKAIIDDKDLRDEDLAFMKKLVEEATKSGSLFVHDQGLHDLIREGMDFMKNIQRLEAAGSMASPGSGGSGAVIIAPQTTNSSPAYVHMEAALGTSDPHTKVPMGHVF